MKKSDLMKFHKAYKKAKKTYKSIKATSTLRGTESLSSALVLKPGDDIGDLLAITNANIAEMKSLTKQLKKEEKILRKLLES